MVRIDSNAEFPRFLQGRGPVDSFGRRVPCHSFLLIKRGESSWPHASNDNNFVIPDAARLLPLAAAGSISFFFSRTGDYNNFAITAHSQLPFGEFNADAASLRVYNVRRCDVRHVGEFRQLPPFPDAFCRPSALIATNLAFRVEIPRAKTWPGWRADGTRVDPDQVGKLPTVTTSWNRGRTSKEQSEGGPCSISSSAMRDYASIERTRGWRTRSWWRGIVWKIRSFRVLFNRTKLDLESVSKQSIKARTPLLE